MKLYQGWEELLPVTDTNINAINFGIETNPHHSYGPILKVEHTLQYVVSGEGFYQIDGATFQVKKGDMFYLPKGFSVKYWANPENPYVYYYVSFDGTIIKTLMEKIGFSIKRPIISLVGDEFIKLFHSMEQALNQSSISSIIMYKSYMYQLIAKLLSFSKENNITLQQKHINEYINLAVEYIKNNYHSNITVSSIAKELGLCRSYLSAIFKKCLGVSPVDYLLRYRIIQAKYLLEQNVSVTDAAMQTGFNSISNFSVQFKKTTGHSPRFYIPQD